MRADTSAPAEVVQAAACIGAIDILSAITDAMFAAGKMDKKLAFEICDAIRGEVLKRAMQEAERVGHDGPTHRALKALNTRPVASTLDPETVEACAKVAVRSALPGSGVGSVEMRLARKIAAAIRALSPGKTGSAGVGEGTP